MTYMDRDAKRRKNDLTGALTEPIRDPASARRLEQALMQKAQQDAEREANDEGARFRKNSETVQAAKRRLGEIAYARRDAQANPAKFHNAGLQKRFLAYLDEEESEQRARQSDSQAEMTQYLQKMEPNRTQMRYNQTEYSRALAVNLARALDELQAETKPAAAKAFLPRAVKPAVRGAAGSSRLTGREEPTGAVLGAARGGGTGGGVKPGSTPAPTPSPTPYTEFLDVRPTPSPTPPVLNLNPNAVIKPGQKPTEPHGSRNNSRFEMTDTGGGTDERNRRKPERRRQYRNDIETVLDELSQKRAGVLLREDENDLAQTFVGIGRVSKLLGELYAENNDDACRYEYGAWDCSRFVQDVYRTTGVMPKFPAGTSHERAFAQKNGWNITTANDDVNDVDTARTGIETGDILMWRNEGGASWHTAIALGDEYVIDCSPKTKAKEAGICVRKIEDIDAQLYQHIQPPTEFRLTHEDILLYLESLRHR